MFRCAYARPPPFVFEGAAGKSSDLVGKAFPSFGAKQRIIRAGSKSQGCLSKEVLSDLELPMSCPVCMMAAYSSSVVTTTPSGLRSMVGENAVYDFPFGGW